MTDWKTQLESGYRLLLDGLGTDPEHTTETPTRVIKALEELISGAYQDPRSVLKRGFQEDHYDQMVTVCGIDFVSLCQHHMLPFYGVVHFAYLPNRYIVGLSKIPRMVEILARRPQIQERLTQQIVQTFQEEIEPLGCAAYVEAWHACVAIRGIRKANVSMRTTALTGIFLEKPAVKEEFLAVALKDGLRK